MTNFTHEFDLDAVRMMVKGKKIKRRKEGHMNEENRMKATNR